MFSFAKYIWPTVVSVLLIVIVGQKLALNHKNNLLIKQSMALDRASALYEEAVRINVAIEKVANEYKKKYQQDEKELAQKKFPENCEDAANEAIEHLRKLYY